MKRFNKIYLEISNLCNLSCAFCPGTKRKKHAMTAEEFSALLPKLRPYADYLYFHLMGEPLLHPHLGEFLRMAGEAGFKVILTTNGTLLPKQQALLLSSPALHKVNISLHAFEANDLTVPFEEYLNGCFAFVKAAEGRVLTVYRLWNQGGADAKNQEILSSLEQFFPQPWVTERKGTRLGNRVYLEYGDKFDWPICPLKTEARMYSATVCGIRSVFSATVPWFPAAWIMRVTWPWATYTIRIWKKS